MINTRKKILKEKGAAPTSLEEEVAKALFDIEVSPSCDFKAELREIYISNATEIEVGKGGAAVIVHIPFRAWKFAKKIQARLIKELEKKFSRKHVIFVANRTILDKDFRRKGMKVRPRSRTLTAVHEAILEDVVGPTEIVGKRTRIGVDGSKTMKILLDPRDKDWRFGSGSQVESEAVKLKTILIPCCMYKDPGNVWVKGISINGPLPISHCILHKSANSTAWHVQLSVTE